MNIAEFSIRKNVITIVLSFTFFIAGIISYNHLSRLEDPEFTIKTAQILTPYPGATAEEVQQEVSDVIERAAQELGQLQYVKSKSMRGLSIVIVEIKDKYDKYSLPQIWDELRRKVNDYQSKLPPGAGPSIVNDDFGDVYGVYVALFGEGYTYAELKDTADLLQKNFLSAEDVKRVNLYGVQPETIYVEMDRVKMANLEIHEQQIYEILRGKNLVASSGYVDLGSEHIPLNPTGEFISEKQFGDLLITNGQGGRPIYLKDVAKIKRGYKDPEDPILRFNGKPAIGIGISTVLGGNVVIMGDSLIQKFKELEAQFPIGMSLGQIAVQVKAVKEAVQGFVINLVEALAIVVVVLLIFMGFRSGLIIGAILLLTICSTFIFMDIFHITLERISLGALIIALGMLVDNAIVVTEGMKVKIEQGEDRIKSAVEVVGQTAFPLLGATVIAIIAFAAIGTSQDSTGEYCRTLFYVILISLGMSWVTAVTVTPLMCKNYLKGPSQKAGQKANSDPYGGKFFQAYKGLLAFCLRFRWITLAVIVSLFMVSLYGFSFVKSNFFPDSTRPQLMIDMWLPSGTQIDKTVSEAEKAEKFVESLDGVEDVATMIGKGHPRFLLTYAPEDPNPDYAQLLVTLKDYRLADKLRPQIFEFFEENIPDAIVGVKKFMLGPGDGGKIQLRISGPDKTEIRKLAETAKQVMREDGGLVTIRDDWENPVKTIRPQFLESQASQVGITRPMLAQALEETFSGRKVGIYREVDDLIPIVARAPEPERETIEDIYDLQLWSPVAGQKIPARSLVSGFNVSYEDMIIARRNRVPTLTLHADAKTELPSEVLKRIKPEIESALGMKKSVKIVYDEPVAIPGKPGYAMAWGGEAENSAKANARLAASIPVFVVMMILILICLFNAIRQPLIICLCVPLAIIGVTAGLLLFNQPFGFMALLGLLSLSGMLIKNAIVLLDEMDFQIRNGKEPYQAILDSGVSRLRPVMMAAVTTIFGMAPLLTDAFFVAMAVTIMFGLGFATILTLLIVPVLYSIFFRIPSTG